MKVSHLEIIGFRGIKSLELNLGSANANIFIGNNGVGKSSLLESIAILFSSFIESVYPQINNRYSPSDKNPSNKNINYFFNDVHGTVNIVTQGLLDSKNEANYLIQDLKANDINNDLVGSLITVTVSRFQNLYKWGKKIDRMWGEFNQFLGEDSLKKLTNKISSDLSLNINSSIPVFVYYTVNRNVKSISLEVFGSLSFQQADAYENALSGFQVNFDSFFRWFRLLEDLENEQKRDQFDYCNIQLEAVRNTIPTFLPGFTDLRVRRSPLRMTVSKNGQELIINQLSDGEKCLLAMVGDIARRLAIANPGLEDPLQGEGIILIDEIELHLHPQWQRGIIPKLTSVFPNCQFIVTTHSPQVISDVKPEQIYLLESTPDGVRVSHPDLSYGRDSNRILEDVMGVPERPAKIKEDLLELFRAIDNNELERAKTLKQTLVNEIGRDEPEFAKAEVLIRRKEILGK